MQTNKPTLEEKELEALKAQLANLEFTIEKLARKKIETLTKINQLKQRIIKTN